MSQPRELATWFHDSVGVMNDLRESDPEWETTTNQVRDLGSVSFFEVKRGEERFTVVVTAIPPQPRPEPEATPVSRGFSDSPGEF